jgi:hypothetical protein
MIVVFDTAVNAKSKEELERACYFFATQLLTDEEIDQLNIEIALKKKLDSSALGYCESLDEGTNQRNFRIELQRGLTSEVLSSLAHEMVHLKQYVRNELQESDNYHKSQWHGTLIADRDEDYYDHPWEIEAYGREVGLRYKYHRTFPDRVAGEVI